MAYSDLLVPNKLNLYCGSIASSVSIPMTFTGPWDISHTVNVQFMKMDNVIICIFPQITGNHGSTNASITSSDIPIEYVPTSTINVYSPLVVNTSSGMNMGLAQISSTFKISSNMAGNTFVTDDGIGILPCVFYYHL